jgi:hypothetical protein
MIIKGGFLTMGTKRLGLARVEALIENLKRDINLKSSHSNLLRFLSGDYTGMSFVQKNDGATDAGFELIDGTVIESAYDGGGAAAITLPAPTAGALCVFRFVAQADGGQSITFTTSSGVFYAAGTLNLHEGGEVGAVMPRAYSVSGTQNDALLGGLKTFNGSSNNVITIATTATNNQTNKGAELAFYSEDGTSWRVMFMGVVLGDGSINATWSVSG